MILANTASCWIYRELHMRAHTHTHTHAHAHVHTHRHTPSLSFRWPFKNRLKLFHFIFEKCGFTVTKTEYPCVYVRIERQRMRYRKRLQGAVKEEIAFCEMAYTLRAMIDDKKKCKELRQWLHQAAWGGGVVDQSTETEKEYRHMGGLFPGRYNIYIYTHSYAF